MKLYQLTDEFLNLYDSLDDPEKPEEEVDQMLAGIAEQITEKAENIGKLVKTWEGEEKSFEEEVKRLQIKRSTLKHRVERIKEYLKHHMEVIGTEKIEGGTFKFAIQKNSRPSIEVDDINLLPSNYVIIQKSPDKDLLYQDWKMGKAIPESARVVQGTHLRIR